MVFPKTFFFGGLVNVAARRLTNKGAITYFEYTDETEYLDTSCGISYECQDPGGHDRCCSPNDYVMMMMQDEQCVDQNHEFQLVGLFDRMHLLDGVAIARVPTKMPNVSCSVNVAYMPVLTRGMAQQQYSLRFMVSKLA